MGLSRLLAKAWVLFCLYAAAFAVTYAFAGGEPNWPRAVATVICALLFAAMGLLFIGGFGASAGARPLLSRFVDLRRVPGFNETLFVLFAALSFLNQVFFASGHMGGGVPDALQGAVALMVPGQRALTRALAPCGLDGGRILAGAFAWFLALIYFGTAIMRVKLAAGITRLERARRPLGLGPVSTAAVLGLAAVAGVQLFYIGSAYPWLPCTAFADVTGALLVGLGPLALSYLVYAAIVALWAAGPADK